MGGGGYDIWRVVPRAWSLIWLEMTNNPNRSGDLPKEWIKEWSRMAPVTLPSSWDDPPDMYKPIPRKNEITEKNAKTLEKALYTILS